MDAIERLLAVEDIKQLKARYFRCMDTKDWAGFAAVFAPDAVMDMRAEGGGVNRGAQAIADSVEGFVGDVVTCHHGHMPEIELTSDSTARGIWAMEDVLRWPQDAEVRNMHGWGHYHETYEKTTDGWRIKTITLSRLRTDFW